MPSPGSSIPNHELLTLLGHVHENLFGKRHGLLFPILCQDQGRKEAEIHESCRWTWHLITGRNLDINLESIKNKTQRVRARSIRSDPDPTEGSDVDIITKYADGCGGQFEQSSVYHKACKECPPAAQ